MPMTPIEARELRAALSEALDPLYAARTGTIPVLDGVTRAIARLHEVDAALLAVVNRAGAPAAFTPEERAWVIDAVTSSQRLAGVSVTRDRAAELLDALEGQPLPNIGDDQEGRGDGTDKD